MNIIVGHSAHPYETYKGSIATPSKEAWEWYQHKEGDVHIFEEECLLEHTKYDGKIKIALLGEVPDIYDHAKQFDVNDTWVHPYRWIKQNHQHFNYIMSPYTFVKDIVGEQKYIWAAIQNSFIHREQIGMYEKERMLSIIASSKNWTIGHRMRHEAIKKFKQYMDVYGNGYNTIIDDHSDGKIIALAPYSFTIIIANTRIDEWVTDQLPDAMLVGTIPIFWGTKAIGKYFNADGIIQFDTVDELGKIIPTLSKELYNSKLSAISENMELARPYSSIAEWLYVNKKDFLENLKL